MPDTTPGLFTPPSRDTARAVLPRAEHTEQQLKLLILQTIHICSPECSTSSFWQETDSWLKSTEEKRGRTELPQLQPGARRGRGKVTPQNSLPSRRVPCFPIPRSHSATALVCGWRAGSWPAPTEVPSNVLLCILSAKDYSCAKQEMDQPLCQEQQIPCSLSSLPSFPKY